MIGKVSKTLQNECLVQGRIQDLIGGGAQIVTGLNCRRCAAALCKRGEPFSAWGLGYFITKYAFSPFWGTFLYYF